MKIRIWEYNNKFYLEFNAVKVKEAQVENEFRKQCYIYIYIYITVLTFTNMIFIKTASRLHVIQFLKLTFSKYLYI